ncbi:Acetoin utilization deacetylase AcuC [Desulfuromusa kysingii]|uniref:Acetoin utilization deacetylase AcuC n=1 Tax=Desulfuromusa kysingii TaxID=37625 RepID=A0A1H3XBH3_9BACT|nr:acetylpolyamine amidohydrolase [Desulfuromusa kysingii]SDZ96291.1 Acetoin utilization deacetylase AcuC [Desulfuromusa kysingii]
MFRIRRLFDTRLSSDQRVMEQVQGILREQFPGLSDKDVNKLPQQLENPLKHKFRAVLYVAEGVRSGVKGFALLLHEPQLGFDYLDYISAATNMTGRGIGGALYERLRADATAWSSRGIFFECLPDDPELCKSPKHRAQNRSRLKFYEQYGARPINGTAYETPVKPGDDSPPYLVFDPLGSQEPLNQNHAQVIVRAILERKYQQHCPPEYIEKVVHSFTDNPVQIRPPRYLNPETCKPPQHRELPEDEKIILVVNDQHDIHHIRERGYVEAPVRIRAITRKLLPTGMFREIRAKRHPEKMLKRVHDQGFIRYLKAVCLHFPEGKSVYPYVFPIRNQARPPVDRAIRAGYYCIDTFTPLTANAYPASRRAVDCALTAANSLLGRQRLAYALVRPPGHHAERRSYGGFCYFNSTAVAAEFLSAHGRVAVLDIDYHHGNGTQDIFYRRADVLTLSIHGHPRFAYPYFTGFDDEMGEGEGLKYNQNYPLQEELEGGGYRKILSQALQRVNKFKPQFFIIALGLDTAKGDPTGTWSLNGEDFFANGLLIGKLHLPTLVVQEGGYDSRALGSNARQFFQGLWAGTFLE